MNDVNSNTPMTPPANAPTSPAISVEELAAKVAELEKQSEGRLRDLRDERQKRQELESRLNQQSSAPAPSPVQNDVSQDELGKLITPYVKAHVAPLEAKLRAADAFVAKTYADKAMDHLAAKSGKSKEAILQDRDFQEKLDVIVRKFGLQGNIYDVSVKAYEIMELENYRSADAERKRQETASASASMPSGTPPPPVVGTREYSAQDFLLLPNAEYAKLDEQGTFVEDAAGKIVFTPHKK